MKKLAVIVALAAFAVVTGCGDDEVPTAKTTNQLKEKRAELGKKAKKKIAKVTRPGKGAKKPEQGKSRIDNAMGTVSEDYVYEETERRDPFRSFLLATKAKDPEEMEQGPLADYELGQLSVVAVVWDAFSPRALVQDPRGRTHILSEGSPVGKNRGRVIHIGDNLVLVKETYVDYAGNESTNDVELRIRGNQGG